MLRDEAGQERFSAVKRYVTERPNAGEFTASFVLGRFFSSCRVAERHHGELEQCGSRHAQGGLTAFKRKATSQSSDGKCSSI